MIDTNIGMWVTLDRRRVLERFSSSELLEEVAARKSVKLPEEKQDQIDDLIETIAEAISSLKSGRADDALLTLERGAFPKFKSLDQGVAQYLRQVRS